MMTITSQQDRTGFPCFVYHASQKPKTVFNSDELKALGPNWSRVYQHQDYPRTVYHLNGAHKVVNNMKEEQKLSDDWSRIPPEGYTDPAARTADDIAIENAKLKKEMMVLENERMRLELAAFKEKQMEAHVLPPLTLKSEKFSEKVGV